VINNLIKFFILVLTGNYQTVFCRIQWFNDWVEEFKTAHVSWKAEFNLDANQTIILSVVDTVTVSFPS